MTTLRALIDPAPAAASSTIRFFLCSTFADFQTERTVLQQRVFPELRRLCAQAGFRLQPIDLRWGVSEEASTDRQTLRICFDELERCRALSPDFFLFILLGERYGSCLLPPVVPGTLVACLLPRLSSEERRTFEAAYRLDENAVPPEYALIRAEGAAQGEDEALRQMLSGAAEAAGIAEEDRLLFAGSATHREIQQGLLGVPQAMTPERGVLCAVRRFGGLPHGQESSRFLEGEEERSAQVRRLVEAVVGRLPPEQVLRYEVAWPDEQGPLFEEEALAVEFLHLLRPQIEAVIATRTAARAVAERGDAAALVNAAFEAERAARVVGRDAELARLAAYLAGEVGAGLPLIVTGAAGSGKSTLLAEEAKRASVAHPGAVLLVCYIGITPGTESLFRLLDSLRRAIATAYGQKAPKPLSDLTELINAVSTQLETLHVPADRPLLLLLDALDQLSPTSQSLEWLPRALPPQVHIIVSVLSDQPELAQLRERVPAEQILSLGPLTREAGRAMLHHLLRADEGRLPRPNQPRTMQGRRLTAAQEAVLLDQFAVQGLPLYLQVAAGEARRWRSFDPATPLPETTSALLNLLLARWENPGRHGPVFVSHALGDLAAARNGLAEDELLELLARDDEVRAELRRLSPNSPPLDPDLPLPVALWARLAAEVEHLLAEHEADRARLFTFYHRQLREMVQARYVPAQTGHERHRALAHYFEAQPLLAGDRPNLRKLSEQPTQEAAGECWSELHHTLSDLGFLEWKIATQGILSALDDLALVPNGDETLERVAAALRLGAHVLERAPEQTEQQLRNRLSEETVARLHDPLKRTGPWLRLDSRTLIPVGSGLLRTLTGHTDEVLACAFSPDGRLVLSASYDHTLRLWEVASGRTVQILKGHTDRVTACAFSPDGRLVLSASLDDQTLRLWNVASGRTMQTLKGHTFKVLACAFSSDGRLVLSASADDTLRLWDVASGWTMQTLEGHTDVVTACAFSPDGRLALSASWDHMLRLWEVASGRTVQILKGHTDSVTACAFSPDGRLALSASYDHTLRLWEVASGRTVQILKGHTNSVYACAFSPDGQLILSASYDHTLRLWEVASGRTVQTLEGHTDEVKTDEVPACAFSPDGRLVLSASYDHTLRLWEVASGRLVQTLKGHADVVSACAFSPDGRLVLSTSWDQTLRLWKVESERVVQTLEGHSGWVRACAFSPDGRLALSASNDHTLRLWEVASGRTVQTLTGHSGWVLACAFSPDGRLVLSSARDDTLRLWDVASGRTAQTLEGHTDYVTACAFSPDGRLVLTASYDHTLRLWEVASGRTVKTLKGHTDYAYACAFSPDGRLVLSASYDHTLRLWDVASGRLVQTLTGHTDKVIACAFSPDGRLALSASDDATLRLWEVASGRTVQTLKGHIGKVKDCAFSPDGRLVLSASWDQTLRLWEVASGRMIARLDVDAPLVCFALSPRGARVVAGDPNGTVYFLTLMGIEETGEAVLSKLPPLTAGGKQDRKLPDWWLGRGHVAAKSAESGLMKRSRRLIKAVEAGELQSVRTLLDQGADTEFTDDTGLTPLHLAASSGHRDIVTALVSAGANIHARDRFGRTPLIHAAHSGDKSTIVYLLLNGADPQDRSDRWSALELATFKGHQQLALLLKLASHADLKYVARLAQSLAISPSNPSESADRLVVTRLLEEKGHDTRFEPLLTAFLQVIRSERLKPRN